MPGIGPVGVGSARGARTIFTCELWKRTLAPLILQGLNFGSLLDEGLLDEVRAAITVAGVAASALMSSGARINVFLII